MNAHPVFTGIGVVAPNGVGVDDYWSATLAGRTGIGRVRRFSPDGYPSTLAGEVRGFEATEYLPGRLIPQTDHMTRLALVAADLAIAHSGVRIGELPEFGAGVMTASSAGGFEFGQRELEKLWRKGPRSVSAYQSYAWFYAVNTGQISIRNRLRGASGVLVTDQAGGLDALAQARRQLRRGNTVMLAGGVDGSVCPWGWVAQMAAGRMSRGDDPDRAYLPFDAAANGHIVGEGGALLVMEDPVAAAKRGARIHGALAGHGSTMDPKPGTGREPGLRQAIITALDDARMSPTEVDVVFADAAGVPELDRIEARAIDAVFGAGRIPVTAPKTMTGRLNAGAGALDVASALLAIRGGVLPPTINVTRDPGLDLDLVTEPRRAVVRTAVVLARGYGGFNSAVVVREEKGNLNDHAIHHP